MTLDLGTLAVVLMLLTVSLSILMTFIWRTNRTYAGFGLWAMSNVVAAVGFLFLSLRGTLPDIMSVVVANSLSFGGFLLAFLGHRKFLDFSGGRAFSLILLILNAFVMVYFTFIDEKLIYRIVFISVFLAIVGGRAAFDFRSAWLKKGNASYQFVGATFATFSLLMIMRAVLTLFFSDIKHFYAHDWIQSLSFIIFIVFSIAWTFLYMVLNNERLQGELAATKTEFEKMATTDYLTGVNNNRRFFEIGKVEIQRAKRFYHPLALIMFDLDFFKKINDTYGHSAGDKVLLAVVEICKFNLRELDSLGRLGGEEFSVLLPHTDIDVGKMVAGRLRRAFDETEITISAQQTIKVTASFGVTELYESDTEIKTLLKRADAALYEAKQNGRNQVKAFSVINQTITTDFPEIDSPQIM